MDKEEILCVLDKNRYTMDLYEFETINYMRNVSVYLNFLFDTTYPWNLCDIMFVLENMEI